MRALVSEARSVAQDGSSRARAASWESHVLSAVGSLAGARWTHLIAFDTHAHAVDWLSPDQPVASAHPRRIAAALASVAQGHSRERVVWLPDLQDGEATLLIEATAQGGHSYWIALGFEEPLTDCQQRVADLISPMAVLLTQLWQSDTDLRGLQRRQLVIAHVLDDLDYGVVAVRADHTPLFMNRVCQELLDDDGEMHLSRGAVRPTNARDAMRFHVALDAVIDSRERLGDDRAEAYLMLLAGRRADARSKGTVLLIAPAPATAGEGHRTDEIAALISIFRPGGFTPRGLEPVCQLLGLSPSETRLVFHLLRGRTVTEAAGDMRIKLETARTYLKQVFAKTETHRQTDLVSMLQHYLPAVRSRLPLRAVDWLE